MDDFLKKLSIYGSIAKDEGKKIAQSVMDRGKEFADIVKIKRDIKIEEDMIKSYKAVIGEYVALNDLLPEDEVVMEQRNKIYKSMEKLDELNEKLNSFSKDTDNKAL